MLVLSRKQNEQINIGEDITITITSLGNKKVGVGIDAPDEVPIVRSEIAGTDRERRRNPSSN